MAGERSIPGGECLPQRQQVFSWQWRQGGRRRIDRCRQSGIVERRAGMMCFTATFNGTFNHRGDVRQVGFGFVFPGGMDNTMRQPQPLGKQNRQHQQRRQEGVPEVS